MSDGITRFTRWDSRYYVNTKEANPQPVWTHPAESATPAAGASAPAAAAAAAPAAGSTSSDTRPLPDGWIQEYSPEHKTYFYVNTKHADPGSTVTWTHPAETATGGISPTNVQSPATASTAHGALDSHASAPASTIPGGVASTTGSGVHGENPDKRPLPTGFITKYDENYKVWYYIDTANGQTTWEHPADKPGAASPPAGGYGAAAAKVGGDHVAAPGGPQTPTGQENPDKRPLPAGWITQFDKGHNAWYYVNTAENPPRTVWEHPAGTAPAIPQHQDSYGAPAAGGYGAPAPGGHAATGSGGAGGKGLEGLLGGSAGKMVGGLFGAKGRTQMDNFANKIGGELGKYKASHPPGGAAGAHGAPPGAPGQPPHQAYGAPTQSYGAPPPGGAPGQHGYGSPAGTPGGYPAQQPQQGYAQQGGYSGQQGYGQQPGAHGGSGGQGGGGFGGLPSNLNQLGSLAGKFGFGKK